MRQTVAVAFVSAVIAILAGDILFWYRFVRSPTRSASSVPRLKWTRGADQSTVATSPIVASDGTLYVASAFAIHAFDPSSAMKWVYRLDAADPVRASTLAQDGAGNLYFTTWKFLYSLSPTGLKRWQADCHDAALARDLGGSPFLADAVYASCDNHLIALNEGDGREVWRLPNATTQSPTPVPAAPLMLHNGELIFSRGQRVFAADRDGNTLWTYPSDPMTGAYLVGLGLDDIIYARKASGELVALDAHGQERWVFNGGRSVTFSESPVTAADGTVYAVAMQGPLFGMTSNGTLKWAFNLPPSTTILGYTPPLLSREGVIYQLLENSVIALSPQRTVLWQMQLGGERHHRGFLALAPDSTLYAVMDNSVVHAIQTRN